MLVRISIFILLFSTNLFGQAEFAVQFGLNNSKMSGRSDSYKTENKIGYQGGFTVNLKVDEKVNFRSGLNLIQKGANIDFTRYFLDEINPSHQWNLKGDQTINYIHIPLNLDIRLSKNENNYFILNLGLYGAMALNGKLNLTNDYIDYDNSYYSSINNYDRDITFLNKLDIRQAMQDGIWVAQFGYLKKYDFGGRFGFGNRFQKVLLEINYEMGLVNMSSFERTSKSTQSLQLNLSYFLSASKNSSN